MSERVPDWLLERIALATPATDEAADPGAVTPHDVDDAMSRLAADPDGRARLDALRRSDAEILAAHPPAVVAARVGALAREASGSRTRRPARWAWAMAAAAALGTAIVVLVIRGDGRVSENRTIAMAVDAGSTPETVRPKGDRDRPQLSVYRKRGDSSEQLAPGAAVRAGDRLQLEYAAGAYRYGVIVSIDGRGAVSLHFPERTGDEPELDAGSSVLLPYSYDLDDAPEFERFLFVASRDRIEPEDVVRAAERLARDTSAARTEPLPIGSDEAGDPPAVDQRSILLRKVETNDE